MEVSCSALPREWLGVPWKNSAKYWGSALCTAGIAQKGRLHGEVRVASEKGGKGIPAGGTRSPYTNTDWEPALEIHPGIRQTPPLPPAATPPPQAMGEKAGEGHLLMRVEDAVTGTDKGNYSRSHLLSGTEG